MILNAYSIYDNKALQYHPPFFASTDGAAVRSLRDLANDPNTTVGRHPSDYVLYKVGTYNDQNGQFIGNTPLLHVMDAVALVELQSNLFTSQHNGSAAAAADNNANGKA